MQTAIFGSPARSDSAKQWAVNTGRTVFSQLMDFLPAYEFQKCVSRYRGEKVEINESKLPKKKAVLYARVSTGD
jgi:Domain of unknown function (DUF4372)